MDIDKMSKQELKELSKEYRVLSEGATDRETAESLRKLSKAFADLADGKTSRGLTEEESLAVDEIIKEELDR